MPKLITISVQNNKHELIQPIAFLSKIIENIGQSDITLEEISNESFEKFKDLGEAYVSMDKNEKESFDKDICSYMKNYNNSPHLEWINDSIDDLTNEQLYGLMYVAEKLEANFLIKLMGYKLSTLMNDK